MLIKYLPIEPRNAVECDWCGDEDAIVYESYENRYGELCEAALCEECLKERRDDD